MNKSKEVISGEVQILNKRDFQELNVTHVIQQISIIINLFLLQ